MATMKTTLDVTPIVDSLLLGLGPTTLYGGLRVNQSDADVIAALGPPARQIPHEVIGEGAWARVIWELHYDRSRQLCGVTMRELVRFVGHVHPKQGNRLDAVTVMLFAPPEALKAMTAAAAALRETLASRYARGKTKSTFRAKFDDSGTGDVSVWFSKPTRADVEVVLQLSAGIIV